MIPPFERTSCDCDRCAAHCHVQPGPLAPGDFERIAERMKLSTSAAMPFFRSSGGTVIQDRRTGEIRRIGSIVPAADSTGRCVFLDASNHCTIHDVAPFGCRMYDSHMPEAVWHPRTVWMIRAVESTPEYQRLREQLKHQKTFRKAGI